MKGMNANQHPKTPLTLAPVGKERHDEPRETCCRTAEKERTAWVLRGEARHQ